jgi:Beta-lactamase
VEREIFVPLGMKDASVTAEAIEKAPDHAIGHRWDPNGSVEIPFDPSFPYLLGPAGAINASLEDCVRWLRLQLGNGVFEGRRLVSAENLAVTRTPKIAINQDLSYAIGWVVSETPNGKALREPINVIFIDNVAKDADRAISRVVHALKRADYPIRMGHSTGYRALIGGQAYMELPRGRDDAFSNRMFEESNNHRRIFGPHQQSGFYIFVGAFSRETVSFRQRPVHRYASFNSARDELSARLDVNTEFKMVGYIDMQNTIRDDPNVTTGDHDGKAALLCAEN